MLTLRFFAEKKNLKISIQNAKFCMLKKANFAKKFCNIFTQPNFYLCNAKTAFVHPQSLLYFHLNVDHLQNNIISLIDLDLVNFVSNVNFTFWLQLQSKLIAAMITELNLYQVVYRID